MPAPGSSQVANGYSTLQHAYSYWHAPAVACSNVLNGCLFVGVARDGNGLQPYLLTERGGFSASGVWSFQAANYDTGIRQVQTPGMMYQGVTGKFTMVYTGIFGVLYHASRSLTGNWPSSPPVLANYLNDYMAPPSVGFDTSNSGHAVAGTVIYGP